MLLYNAVSFVFVDIYLITFGFLKLKCHCVFFYQIKTRANHLLLKIMKRSFYSSINNQLRKQNGKGIHHLERRYTCIELITI